MATNNKDQICPCPMCQSYGTQGFHQSFFLRWVLGLIAILMIFWLGMKVGELRSLVDNDFGRFHHGDMMYGQYPGMMNLWATPSTGTVPKTTTTK